MIPPFKHELNLKGTLTTEIKICIKTLILLLLRVMLGVLRLVVLVVVVVVDVEEVALMVTFLRLVQGPNSEYDLKST